jgi:NADPH:quinone reductase-like Zn-dependent oxidoreductase
MTMMLAATVRRYGGPDVVTLETLPRPKPKPGELSIRVTAAAVTAADARLRANDAPRGFGILMRLITGVIRPRNPVPGMEFAGVVDALGSETSGYSIGQRVFGITGLKGGTQAEYLTIKANGKLFATPDTLTDPEAAAFFFGGLTAADFLLDKAALRSGQRLLVNGATGAVGSAALQIARHLGAHVTAVARAENHAFARDLGADTTLDYRDGPISGHWDAILDVVGTLPYPKAAPLLSAGGRLLPVTATLAEQLSYSLRPKRGPCHISGGVIADTPAAMQRLIRLHRDGSYRPIVGTVLPLAQIAKAHALAGSGHKTGNVVVVPSSSAENS